jgi:PPOX class probable F420-dependent enzyme
MTGILPGAACERLSSDLVAWLTTVTPAGSPVPAPVWCVRDEDTIVMYSSPTAKKITNIGSQPRVSLSFNCDAQGRDVAVIRGVAELRTGTQPSANSAYMAKYAARIAELGMSVENFDELSTVEIRIRPTGVWLGSGKLTQAHQAETRRAQRPRVQAQASHAQRRQATAAKVVQMSSGYKLSRIMYTAIELGVPDLLQEHGGTASVAYLATLTHVDPRIMALLLQALTDAGLLSSESAGEVSLTEEGRYLTTKEPGSVRATVLAGGAPWHWQLWQHLTMGVRAGGPITRRLFGADFYEYLGGHPEVRARWQAMLSSYASRHYPQVAAAYDFAAAGRLADLGGGGSSLLLQILARVPEAHGVIVDLPGEVDTIRQLIADAGLSARCEVAGADLFTDQLPEADLYLLSGVVNDWPTEQVVAILSRCAEAVGGGGRVLVAGTVAPADRSRNPGFDLELLLTTGGWERSEAEHRDLMQRSGLTVVRTIDAAPLTLFEAVATAAE